MADGASAEDPIVVELKEKYHAMLKGEKGDIEKYHEKLEEMMFDFFNMIKKEYIMSLEKYLHTVRAVHCDLLMQKLFSRNFCEK